jgi:hypothetical protein
LRKYHLDLKNVSAIGYNCDYQQTKGDTMSANVYTIENLLVGKLYRSRSVEGEIISAEKHPACIHYDGAEAYLVEVRPTYYTTSGKSRWFGNTTYRTVAVAD